MSQCYVNDCAVRPRTAQTANRLVERGQFYIVEALSYIPTSSGYEPSCASASDGPRNAGGGFAPSLTRMASACTPRLNKPVSMRMS